MKTEVEVETKGSINIDIDDLSNKNTSNMANTFSGGEVTIDSEAFATSDQQMRKIT